MKSCAKLTEFSLGTRTRQKVSFTSHVAMLSIQNTITLSVRKRFARVC